jgi:curved DNA-binding protein CbpA
MVFPDVSLYATLDLLPGASSEAIEEAFALLSSAYSDPEYERTLQDVAGAHRVLANPQARAAYDRGGWRALVNAPGLLADLGLDEDADMTMIWQSYRFYAMLSHPDKNPGDERAAAMFASVNEAFEVLSALSEHEASSDASDGDMSPEIDTYGGSDTSESDAPVPEPQWSAVFLLRLAEVANKQTGGRRRRSEPLPAPKRDRSSRLAAKVEARKEAEAALRSLPTSDTTSDTSYIVRTQHQRGGGTGRAPPQENGLAKKSESHRLAQRKYRNKKSRRTKKAKAKRARYEGKRSRKRASDETRQVHAVHMQEQRKRAKNNNNREQQAHKDAPANVEAALHSFYNDSTTFKDSVFSATACQQHIRDQFPTTEDKLRIHESLTRMLSGDAPRRGCAVCGRTGPSDQFEIKDFATHGSQLDLLRVSALDSETVPPFADVTYDRFRTRTTVDDTEYCLDSNFVDVSDAEASPKVSVCATCHSGLKQHTLPQFCLARGFDFCDVAKFGLEQPNLGEQILLAKTHLFSISLKYSLSGKLSDSLTGHVISFASDTPHQTVTTLSGCWDALADHVTVSFVGSKQQFENSKPMILRDIEMQLMVRPAILRQWFSLLHAVHPLYADLDINDIEFGELVLQAHNTVHGIAENIDVLSSQDVITMDDIVRDDAAADAVRDAAENATATIEPDSDVVMEESVPEQTPGESGPNQGDPPAPDTASIIHAPDVCVLQDPATLQMGLRTSCATILHSLNGNEDAVDEDGENDSENDDDRDSAGETDTDPLQHSCPGAEDVTSAPPTLPTADHHSAPYLR